MLTASAAEELTGPVRWLGAEQASQRLAMTERNRTKLHDEAAWPSHHAAVGMGVLAGKQGCNSFIKDSCSVHSAFHCCAKFAHLLELLIL